ncbi:MAG: DUF4124 domain-containing protein [Myxococcota bacterium]
MARLALSLAVLLPAVAAAQPIYTWTDREGVQHYTDDPRTIPKDAKATATEGAHVNVVSSSAQPEASAPAPASGSPTRVQVTAAQAQAAASPAQAAATAQATLEDTWRQRFRDARDKVRTLEDEIEVDRQRVEEVNGLPVDFGFSCPPGWGAASPPVAPSAAGLGAVAVAGQVGPGVTVSAGVGTRWSQGWYFPSTVVTPCVWSFNPAYERIRDRLARNRKALVRAKEELGDLERRAALEAVPLEWRR